MDVYTTNYFPPGPGPPQCFAGQSVAAAPGRHSESSCSSGSWGTSAASWSGEECGGGLHSLQRESPFGQPPGLDRAGSAPTGGLQTAAMRLGSLQLDDGSVLDKVSLPVTPRAGVTNSPGAGRALPR